MKYIDEGRIENNLAQAGKASAERVAEILEKSRKLQRLSLDEAACLLSAQDPLLVKSIFETAAEVKDRIYGKRVVLFAPLYISNLCANACLYCAFKSDNKEIVRKALSMEEIKQQV